MNKTRFLMVGGFLGAGKTTALGKLARRYLDQDLRVGLVTNDQAYDLVDTQTLRAQGFQVGEVPGACFCCKFGELIETAGALAAADQPDVILAEPVGSCTDLVATVIEPLRQLYGDRYEVGPLAVLLKPEHGQKILSGEDGSGFSPKAAYIFLKQIEEADIVAINKIDKLSPAERDHLVALVQERFPEKQVMAVSARHGEGLNDLTAALSGPSPRHETMMAVDYDVYAEGEAELGWLNCTAIFTTRAARFSLDEAVTKLVACLKDAFEEAAVEPAHLKVMGRGDEGWAVGNLVGSGQQVELSQASRVTTRSAEVIVNARVATDPDQLAALVREQVAVVAELLDTKCQIEGMQHFRPGRPVPTHRVS